MKLKNIADMETYLNERCYCPYEIYDMSGFFFECFKPDLDCEVIAEGEQGAVHGTFVVCKNKEHLPQIIYIEHDNGYVEDCTRVDATDHNIQEIKKFMLGQIPKMNLDEYRKGATAKSLKEMLSIADMVMV